MGFKVHYGDQILRLIGRTSGTSKAGEAEIDEEDEEAGVKKELILACLELPRVALGVVA